MMSCYVLVAYYDALNPALGSKHHMRLTRLVVFE